MSKKLFEPPKLSHLTPAELKKAGEVLMELAHFAQYRAAGLTAKEAGKPPVEYMSGILGAERVLQNVPAWARPS